MFNIGSQKRLHLYPLSEISIKRRHRAILPWRSLQCLRKVPTVDMATLVRLKIVLPIAEYMSGPLFPVGQAAASVSIIIAVTPDIPLVPAFYKKACVFTDILFRDVIRPVGVIAFHDPYDYFIRPCFLDHLTGFTVIQASPAAP